MILDQLFKMHVIFEQQIFVSYDFLFWNLLLLQGHIHVVHTLHRYFMVKTRQVQNLFQNLSSTGNKDSLRFHQKT